ncbi:hypothetical protein lerEdw1_020714, partial [Lerista edwardsae]
MTNSCLLLGEEGEEVIKALASPLHTCPLLLQRVASLGLDPEEVKKDHSAGRALRWEGQWLDFLERVKSEGMLEEEEEEALWGEAKCVASVGLGPGHPAVLTFVGSWAMPWKYEGWHGRGSLSGERPFWGRLRGAPLDLDSTPIWSTSLCCPLPAPSPRCLRRPAWDGAERLPSQREEGLGGQRPRQVVVGPQAPDPLLPDSLHSDGVKQPEPALGLMSDSGNEGAQPRRLLEGGEEETLRGWEGIRGAEEKMDEMIPWLDEAFEAQARQREGRGEGSPGTQSSLSAEGGPNSAWLPEESLSQISISGSGALGTAEKRRKEEPVREETPCDCREGGSSFKPSARHTFSRWSPTETGAHLGHLEHPSCLSRASCPLPTHRSLLPMPGALDPLPDCLYSDGVKQPEPALAGLLSDSGNEGDQPGTLLERDEEETLR